MSTSHAIAPQCAGTWILGRVQSRSRGSRRADSAGRYGECKAKETAMFNTSARCTLGCAGSSLADIVLRSHLRAIPPIRPKTPAHENDPLRHATTSRDKVLNLRTTSGLTSRQDSSAIPSHLVATTLSLPMLTTKTRWKLGRTSHLSLSASPSRHQNAERQANMDALNEMSKSCAD